MKIGILGTRGIPNYYGGFEQFAEYLSQGLQKNGHQVYVYCSHLHPFKKKRWNGVELIHCFDLEDKIGTAGQFIYDLNCILDSRKRNFDVLLQLGYTSNSIWSFLLSRETPVATNMDGLEWKRSKFSKKVQKFLKYAEKRAVNSSDLLIADSVGIQKHLQESYQKDSEYIPYGSEVFNNPSLEVLKEYNVDEDNYYMLIARLEPENNIELILDGYVKSGTQLPFLVIGKTSTPLGKRLVEKYSSNYSIKFLGGVYNQKVLNNLRFYATLYFHGHSVGGTNPSLLEAMGSSAVIVAHQNIFNRSILGNDAKYFNSPDDVSMIINNPPDELLREKFVKNNIDKIQTTYAWETIIESYEDLLLKLAQLK